MLCTRTEAPRRAITPPWTPQCSGALSSPRGCWGRQSPSNNCTVAVSTVLLPPRPITSSHKMNIFTAISMLGRCLGWETIVSFEIDCQTVNNVANIIADSTSLMTVFNLHTGISCPSCTLLWSLGNLTDFTVFMVFCEKYSCVEKHHQHKIWKCELCCEPVCNVN